MFKNAAWIVAGLNPDHYCAKLYDHHLLLMQYSKRARKESE